MAGLAHLKAEQWPLQLFILRAEHGRISSFEGGAMAFTDCERGRSPSVLCVQRYFGAARQILKCQIEVYSKWWKPLNKNLSKFEQECHLIPFPKRGILS